MDNLKITVEQIKELMDAMSKTGLGEVCVSDGDFKLKLSAKKEASPIINMGQTPDFVMPEAHSVAMVGGNAPAAAAAQADESSAPEASLPAGNVMKSPIVGTFYAAPSPDKPPFVEVGKKVKKGDVLFIIESMKLMNEIQSEFDGEVTEILCENGQAVEFGQPIMVIK